MNAIKPRFFPGLRKMVDQKVDLQPMGGGAYHDF